MSTSKITQADRESWEGFKSVVFRAYVGLATIGFGTCALAILGYATGAVDFQFTTPRMDSIWTVVTVASLWCWENAGNIVKAVTTLMFAYALVDAASKIQTVFNIVKAFNEARSPISELKTSVIDMEEAATGFTKSLAGMRSAADDLKDHAPMLRELNGKLEAIMGKINRLEEEQISQRTTDEAATYAEDGNDEENWEELRSIWRRNNQRLEEVIATRLKGQRRAAFDNYSRSDWPAIMDKLAKLGLLRQPALDASKELHKLFMRHKSRKRVIGDEIVGAARVLDKQLEMLVRSGVTQKELGEEAVETPLPNNDDSSTPRDVLSAGVGQDAQI